MITGENAIEKMCVTNVGLMQEYGNQVPLEGCTMANRDRVRFCVCDTNDCNRASLNEQVIVKVYDISNVSRWLFNSRISSPPLRPHFDHPALSVQMPSFPQFPQFHRSPDSIDVKFAVRMTSPMRRPIVVEHSLTIVRNITPINPCFV